MFVVDTNILVYAADDYAPDHELLHAIVGAVARGARSVAPDVGCGL